MKVKKREKTPLFGSAFTPTQYPVPPLSVRVSYLIKPLPMNPLIDGAKPKSTKAVWAPLKMSNPFNSRPTLQLAFVSCSERVTARERDGKKNMSFICFNVIVYLLINSEISKIKLNTFFFLPVLVCLFLSMLADFIQRMLSFFLICCINSRLQEANTKITELFTHCCLSSDFLN